MKRSLRYTDGMLILAALGFVVMFAGNILYFKGSNKEARTLGLISFYSGFLAFMFGIIYWAYHR